MISLFIVYVIHIYVNLHCVHTYIIETLWRYSDLISRSFYNHFIFYIIYADIFILIKLCCSATMSSNSLHIDARSIIILSYQAF